MRHSLLVCLVCALASPAFAEEPAQPKPSQGPRDPDDLVVPGVGKPAPRKPPVTTKPSSLIILHYKRVAGVWHCKGTTARGDGSSSAVGGRVVVKLDLDNAWIVTTFRESTGPLKWTEYRTYDSTAKTWTKVQLVNTTGYVVSTSAGETGGEIVWTGSAKSPHGSVRLRDHEKLEPKQLTLWGEAMIGTAWQKIYQVTCKR